jgi:hypothetical protein
MFLVGVGFMFELAIFCIVVGFVVGYFSNSWLWTRKVAKKLDEILGRKS